MFYKTVAHCITNQQQVKSVTRTNWMAKLFLLLLLSLLGGGDKMSQCVCVCACVFVCVWVSLCVWVVNACTCAWRARRRQPSPEGGIYLKRASHDLAWSRRFILRWGLCVHVCACVCVSACARVHAQRWGICGSFQRLSPPRTGLHSYQRLVALIWLTAWSSFQPRSSPPARSKYLLKNRICHETTGGKLLSPSCSQESAEEPVSPSASLSVCLLFVSATLLRPSLFPDSAGCDSLTDCQSGEVKGSALTLSR